MVDRRCRVVLICLSLFFYLLIDGTVEQRISVNRQEWLALLQLRSSLGLRAREWPINSDPCTSWVGIRCTSDMVTGINISGFRRTRRGRQNPQFSIDALGNLTLLSSFNASNFALPGTIPEWMGLQLHALQVLDLSSCFISGSIPRTLGNLSSLLELHLSGNALTGVIPSSLTQLTSLNVLNLSQNSLHGQIPATLAALGNLTLLELSSNFLSGPIPPEIGTFSRLRSLNLSRNSFSSSFPPQLSGLSSLVDLDLGYNSLSGPLPSDMGGLTNLRVFIVGKNFLIGRLPDAFWSMPSLQFLDMSVNNFTGTLPTTTTPRAPNTTAPILNISHNLLYGAITPSITTFRFVDMSGNYFEGPVPSYALAAATSLDRNCLRNSTGQRSRADCASFYADRNLVFDNFGQPNVTQDSRPSTSTGRRLVVILASVFGGVGLVGLVLLIIWLFITCKRRRARAQTRPRGTTTTVEEPPIPSGGPTLDLPNLGSAFTYEKIIEAAGEFGESNLLKNGHSGDLYIGVLDDGVPVVVKRFDVGSVGNDSYESEMEVLSKVSPHPRLVPLLGHCSEREEAKFLVYRRMPNGDLSRCLFRETGVEGSVQSLDWITRVKIAIGAAEALSYLHHECNPPLVHRDVQASSILLDDKYEVRLGSLSMVCAQEADVHQSRITKFLRLSQSSDLSTSGTPNATCSYDVYCFGKVLLELLTGNLGISSPLADPAASREWTDAALRHVSVYDKELVTGILDPSLIIHDDLLDEMWAMAIVARSCLNPRPSRRPIMRYVLKALENPLKVVRDEQQHTGASSRGSWNGTLFGSWRQSSSDAAAQPPDAVGATTSGVKLAAGGSSGRRRLEASGSHGNNDSNNNNNDGNNNNGNSSSARKSSREICPEPFVEGGI